MKRDGELRLWEERFRREYGEEYSQFLLVKFQPPPRVCPVCRTATIRELWLGDAARMLGKSLSGLWYLWCDSCLRCIRSPLGACPVPNEGSYYQWSDGQALLHAMPRGLQMIEPVPLTQGDPRQIQTRIHTPVTSAAKGTATD